MNNVTIPANGIPFYLQRAEYFLDIQQKKVENVNPVFLKKKKKKKHPRNNKKPPLSYHLHE